MRVVSKILKHKMSREENLLRLTDYNQSLYLDYEIWLNNHEKNYANDTKKQMANNALNLLTLYPNVNANELDIQKVETYFGGSDRASSNNNKVNFTKNFFLYLIGRDIVPPIEPEVLDGYRFKRKEVEADAQEEGRPFSIKEIILVRNALKTEHAPLFIFEMVYAHGLTLSELIHCTEKNYDFELHAFRIKGREKPVKVSERVHSLIVEHRKLLKPIKGNSANQERLSQVSKKLQELLSFNRQLRYRDIEATRRVNFLKCPGCGDSYENTPDNWAIIQYESDENNNKWIVCKANCTQGESK